MVARLLPLIPALALLAGCAVASVDPSARAVNFCVLPAVGQGGPLTRSMTATPPKNPARLHSLRVVGWDRALAEGCDVMLEISEGVLSTNEAALKYSQDTGRQADCGITAYSAYTKNWVLKNAASAPDCTTLEYNLKRDFQPDKPSHKAIGFGAARTATDEI